MEQHQLLYEEPVVGNSLSPLVADIGGFCGRQPPSPPWLGLDLDVQEPSSAGSGSQKKLSHNAYERDRRKELNDLYSTLRSLLPDADRTKKLSIPTTLYQILEYIPRLRKQVEDLEKKKEGLQMTRARCSAGKVPMSGRTTPVVVSATPLDEKEIMVQVSLLSTMAKSLPLSKCVQVLEDEGLQLISSSTLSNLEVNRAFYNLHVQRSQEMKEYPELLCDKLEKAIEQKAAPYLQ